MLQHAHSFILQTCVDATVYAIPGVVGGIAIVDAIISDVDNAPLQQQYA